MSDKSDKESCKVFRLDPLSEARQENEALLAQVEEIADTLGIGSLARTRATILTNIENGSRRASCLSLIEHQHTELAIDSEGEEYQDDLLNWGESPEVYIETYKSVIAANNASIEQETIYGVVNYLREWVDNSPHLPDLDDVLHAIRNMPRKYQS